MLGRLEREDPLALEPPAFAASAAAATTARREAGELLLPRRGRAGSRSSPSGGCRRTSGPRVDSSSLISRSRSFCSAREVRAAADEAPSSVSSRSFACSAESWSFARCSQTAFTRANSASFRRTSSLQSRQQRRDLLVDRLQLVVRLGAGQGEEDVAHLREQLRRRSRAPRRCWRTSEASALAAIALDLLRCLARSPPRRQGRSARA